MRTRAKKKRLTEKVRDERTEPDGPLSLFFKKMSDPSVRSRNDFRNLR